MIIKDQAINAQNKKSKELGETILQQESLHQKLEERISLNDMVEIKLRAQIDILEKSVEGTAQQENINMEEEKIQEQCEIKELHELVDSKVKEIDNLEKRLINLPIKHNKAMDEMAEKNIRIKEIDNFYDEMLQTKDESIKILKRIYGDDDVSTGFRRLLMKRFAEEEHSNLKQMYNNIKYVDMGTQCNNSSAGSTSLREDTDACNNGDVNNASENVISLSGTSGEPNSNKQYIGGVQLECNSDELISIRVKNLPAGSNVERVRDLLHLERNIGKISIQSINGRLGAMLIVPVAHRDHVLACNGARINQKTLWIGVVEKCRLGGACQRKVCRFGHPERDVLENEAVQSVVNEGEKSFIKISPLPRECNEFDIKEMLYVDERTDVAGQSKVLAISPIGDFNQAEAIIEVPKWVGKKIIRLNGTKVAGQTIFVEELKICKFGHTCSRPCTFYHLNWNVQQMRDNVIIDGYRTKSEILCANNGKYCKWIPNCGYKHTDGRFNGGFNTDTRFNSSKNGWRRGLGGNM